MGNGEDRTMVKIEVPYIDQSIKFPTGCESVSTVMLLHYLGCSMSVEEFIERYLEKVDFERRGNELWGANPWERFCGSPYKEDGFGCYAPVIRQTLERIFTERNLSYEVYDETGSCMERLLTEYIDQGIPVIFWACINMREPVTGPDWKLFDSGETFTWISNEHCMLLVGYDEEGYYFNDPYENNGVVRYPKELTEKRHAAQYSMAVGVKNA